MADSRDLGYMGLRPRPDLDGRHRLHGVFSSFIPGTTSTDPNCSDGADGGAGVSCANDFDAVIGRTYDIRIQRTGADTWTGTAIDAVTGAQFHIGTYRLPPGSGNLKNSQVGFMENYWNFSRTCEGIQRIDVTVEGPRTSSGLKGRAYEPTEYGNCLGQANYAATEVGSGVWITRGWLATAIRTRNGLAAGVADWALGTQVELGRPSASFDQSFIFAVDGTIRSPRTANTCLDTAAGATAEGTAVIAATCTGAASQQWTRSGSSVRHGASGHCLAVDGPRKSGAGPVIAHCNRGVPQQWSFTD